MRTNRPDQEGGRAEGAAVKKVLDKLRIDGFILGLFGMILLATVLPAQGAAVEPLSWATKIAIAVLFFLYGARLHPQEALDGLKHWRLHSLILAFTFVLFPLIGAASKVLEPVVLAPALYTGWLFMTLVPSTVQSSIAFTSIARGNVAGAVVSASASNLLGILITPLLVIVMGAVGLLGTTGAVTINARSVLDIVLQLLLPFALGQLARPWVGKWVTDNAKHLKYVDRGGILLVVYAAFSEGVRDDIWSTVGVGQLLALVVLSVGLVAVMLWVTKFAAQRAGFDRADAIAVQFCGTKKSLATGLPMAAVLFVGQPIGLIVLPLMVFHQVQLIMCSVLASRYGNEPEPA